MVNDTRESVKVALGDARGEHTGEFIAGALHHHIHQRKGQVGLGFNCRDDPPFFSSTTKEEYPRACLEKERNSLRRGSFACLLSGKGVVAFVTIICDIDLLVRYPCHRRPAWEEGRSQRTPYSDSNDALSRHWLRSAPLSLHTNQFFGVSK